MPKPKPKKDSRPVEVDPRSIKHYFDGRSADLVLPSGYHVTAPTLRVTNEQLRHEERRRRENDRELLRLLGRREPKTVADFDDLDRIVCEVEVIVSQFRPWLRDPPRSDAYYRECMKPIAATAEALLSSVRASQERVYLDALGEQSGVSVQEIERALAQLCDALRKEIAQLDEGRKLDKSKGRGRPSMYMRRQMMRSLGELFRGKYRGSARKKREREIARNKFVRHVLSSYGIYCPKDIAWYFRSQKASRPNKK